MSVANNLTQSAIAALPTAELRAEALGLPATLFGIPPSQKGYWHEPGLPWLTPQIWANPPIGRLGVPLTWFVCDMGGNSMAPRFPKGCRVNIAPIGEKQNLVVGKVYVYCYQDGVTGESTAQIGRLESVGESHLEARADNEPTVGLIWRLREDKRQETWDVWEVPHYADSPGEAE